MPSKSVYFRKEIWFLLMRETERRPTGVDGTINDILGEYFEKRTVHTEGRKAVR